MINDSVSVIGILMTSVLNRDAELNWNQMMNQMNHIMCYYEDADNMERCYYNQNDKSFLVSSLCIF